MSVKHVVLGLVVERPGHARDVAARLEVRVPSLAPALSGVHSALDELRRERFVRSTGATAHVPRQARRAVYEATELGVTRFDAWINAPSAGEPSAHELQLKVAVAQPRNVERLIEITYEQDALCMQRLAETDPGSFTEVVARGDLWAAVGELAAREIESVQIQATLKANARIRDLLRWAERQLEADEGGSE